MVHKIIAGFLIVIGLGFLLLNPIGICLVGFPFGLGCLVFNPFWTIFGGANPNWIIGIALIIGGGLVLWLGGKHKKGRRGNALTNNIFKILGLFVALGGLILEIAPVFLLSGTPIFTAAGAQVGPFTLILPPWAVGLLIIGFGIALYLAGTGRGRIGRK